jgi:hypothetical protein
MVIGSVDTLRGTQFDWKLPPQWNDAPPILRGGAGTSRGGRTSDEQPETERLLKGMVRLGVPPALRCAVWLSNVFAAVHPQQPPSYWHEYRTLSKVRALDAAYDRLLRTVIQTSDGGNGDDDDDEAEKDAYWKTVQAPTYGRSVDAAEIEGVTEAGRVAVKRVLVALEGVLGMEVAPLLPALVSLLLTCMSESYAFAAVREMAHHASWYLAPSRTEHGATCRAFADVLRKLHGQTAAYLDERDVLTERGLQPIFQDMFVGVLPLPYVQRIVDIYTLEGVKVLFRFGVAVLVLYKKACSEHNWSIQSADEWWHTLRSWAHSPRFNFEVVVRKAYGVHGRGLRKQMRFPRRHILQRIIRMEEERLRAEGAENASYAEAPAKPLGLVARPPAVPGEEKEEARPVLAHSLAARQHLAEWLPLTLRLTNLDVIYSTNVHGRSLDMLYRRVKDHKHTLLLCEVLTADGSPCVIGMYASQAWRPSSEVYGDGGCFLFRLEPEAAVWKWHPKPTVTASGSMTLLDSVDLEDHSSEEESNTNRTALLEQFMVGTSKYISMGGNPDGSCGLRLNEDLTIGESSAAVGFDNEPLHGEGKGSVFDVGLVEVYGLVRQIDGRAV